MGDAAIISDREAFLWSQRGITFKIPTIDDYKDIKTFLVNIFFPEEPFFRGLNLMEKSKIDILERHFVKFILEKRKVKNGLKEATSMIALDETNTIVGVRLGSIFDKSDMKSPSIGWMTSVPEYFIPKKFHALAMIEKFLDSMGYGKKSAFLDFPNATKIYSGQSVCVSPKARGLGLGKELIRRTNVLAKDKGCSHVYILATSLYSQKIFQSLKFQVHSERDYDTYKNKDGSNFFKDMGVHKSAQLVVFDLLTSSSPCSN